MVRTIFLLVWLCLCLCLPVASFRAAVAADTSRADYVLGIGDEIKLTVYGEQDLSGQYKVGSTGAIALPLIGDSPAAGRTLGQFEKDIEYKLAAGYLKNPRVSAQIASYRPFFILGEVAHPGSYPYVDNMTVRNAAALAGGYTYRADHDDIRMIEAADPAKREHAVSEDDNVRPGDVIRVTERLF